MNNNDAEVSKHNGLSLYKSSAEHVGELITSAVISMKNTKIRFIIPLPYNIFYYKIRL